MSDSRHGVTELECFSLWGLSVDVDIIDTGGAGRGHHRAGCHEGLRRQDVGRRREYLLVVAAGRRWDAAGLLGDDHRYRGTHHGDGRHLQGDEAAAHDLDAGHPHDASDHGTVWLCYVVLCGW